MTDITQKRRVRSDQMLANLRDQYTLPELYDFGARLRNCSLVARRMKDEDSIDLFLTACECVCIVHDLLEEQGATP